MTHRYCVHERSEARGWYGVLDTKEQDWILVHPDREVAEIVCDALNQPLRISEPQQHEMIVTQSLLRHKLSCSCGVSHFTDQTEWLRHRGDELEKDVLALRAELNHKRRTDAVA